MKSPSYHESGVLFVWKVEVQQSHYSPGQALRVPGRWGTQISRHPVHEGGKVVSPTRRPLLPPGNIPGTHFCLRLSQPQGHIAAMTPWGNEPATFRLVAQCPNQLRCRVPPLFVSAWDNWRMKDLLKVGQLRRWRHFWIWILSHKHLRIIFFNCWFRAD